MSLDKSDTIDRREAPETMPSFQMNEALPPGAPKRHGWIWLVVLAAVALGIYYYRSQSNPAKAATGSAQTAGGGPGRTGGTVEPSMRANAVAVRLVRGWR